MTTGFEIHTKLADPDSIMVRVFTVTGLSKLVGLIVHQYKLEIVVDGEMYNEKDPLVPHFVACAPGEHEVEVTLLGWEGANHLYNTAREMLTVEDGKVTLVDYVFKSGVMLPGKKNTELITTGTRPA